MGWFSISSPPVPATALVAEPLHDSPPPPEYPTARVWLRYRAYDLTQTGIWRWAQFDTPAHRASWCAIWREDFEIVLSDTPPSDAG